MRSRDFYWMLVLVASLGFLAFLGFNFWKTLSSGEESDLFALTPVSSPVASFPSLEEIKEEELFLASYPEGELANFRNLFQSAIAVPWEVEKETVAVLPEESEKEVVYIPSQEVTPAQEEVEEEIPPLHLQGVVVSGPRQAVIVEVEGKIQILTNEKNLSSDIKLVKVKDKEVVINYEGREVTLTFEN